MTIGYYGGDGFGSSPYGSLPPQIGVLNAASLSNTEVQVNFTQLIDLTFASFTNIANYSIPGLTISAAAFTASNAVVLTTSPQTNILYTVTVAAARSTFGQPLNPAQNTATFTGTVPIPGFSAVPTTATRVRLVFSAVMLNNSALTNPTNYTVTDLNNNAIPIVSVTLEQTINPVSLVLTLGTPLGEDDFYVATVSPNVKTILGLNVLPPTNVFQWIAGDNQFQIPLSLFTGEVSGGFFGNPDGLVYFSPALNVPTANSIIQIEDIDVCTTAYDTYTPPVMIDPIPLFTYGGGLVPTPNPDPYLLNQCVLWAPFPRNFEAQITLGFTGAANQDSYTPPVDTSCGIILAQQFALGYVSLLNDPDYYLLPANSPPQSVPPMFITAKNLSPIPPGPETIIMLHVQLSGEADMPGPIVDGVAPPMVATKHGFLSSTMAGNSQLFAGAGPPPVVLAQASLSAGSTMTAAGKERLGALANLNGVSVVRALATEGNPPPTVIFASSFLSAFAGVTRAVAASPAGDSTLSAFGTVRRSVAASLLPVASVTAEATARWAAGADILATSAVTADATVTHKAEAFPVGIAELSATAS